MEQTISPYATTQFDAGTIFSGKASGTQVFSFAKTSDYTLSVDTRYQFHDSSRDVIVWFLMQKPEPLYLYGPTGCGKSSLVRQLAAQLNYLVFEVTGHERLEITDLIGHLAVDNGSMKFEDGPLTMAMRVGWTIFNKYILILTSYQNFREIYNTSLCGI